MNSLLQAEHISFLIEGESILNDLSFNIYKGECIVLTGKSGSGKTILGKVLAGHYPVSSGTLKIHSAKDIKRIFVHQQHDFRFAFQNRTYLGQRYDRNYTNEFPTVLSVLKKEYSSEKDLHDVISLLNLEHKLQQSIIELSNGEGKRVQLAQALLLKPDLLILDQPFIGLDTDTRLQLHELLTELKKTAVTIIVITTEDEIPSCTDRIFILNEGRIERIQSFNTFVPQTGEVEVHGKHPFDWERIQIFPDQTFDTAVRMEHVNIRVSDTYILNDISWTVKRGEHWSLNGHNGSGKSTLLSLITGDNPQVYLNEVYLFDKKRGSGESVWDIKKKIGYVSPEMHAFFQRSTSYSEAILSASNDHSLSGFSQEQTTCFEAVCSGFRDQIGSSFRITDNQHKIATYWIEALDLNALIKKPFYKASLGEQRLLLLARALVKNPPLLLLDEPCQGLDKKQTRQFTSIIDVICKHTEQTLIYVSHYDADIPTCIDRKMVLEKGKRKV